MRGVGLRVAALGPGTVARHRSGAVTLSLIDGVEQGAERLAADLASGAWERRNAALLDADWADMGYRLVVARSG